ncbi:hypothetical protein KAI92_04365 [Candidatus Parcubacteria bacterium]|nr:hypothetical protein [Candidatus Parcubacteria bacterium]
MFRRFIHFIKYNNIAVFVILAVFLLGGGVFAQTDLGQEIIGEKQKTVEGVDNTLLIEADINNLDMNFKIEQIEEDTKYYYVTYTFYDLVKDNDVWKYQVIEKVRKISKKRKKDLGEYLAKEFKQQYQDRVRNLKKAQNNAKDDGVEQKIEVEEYSGLIGGTLNLVEKVFSNYEPVKKRIVPSPSVPILLTTIQKSIVEDGQEVVEVAQADSLTKVYDDYITENDSDGDNIFGADDNCPNNYNPEQLDSDEDGIGDECDNSLDDIQSTDDDEIASSGDDIIIDDTTASTGDEVIINDETASSGEEVIETIIDEEQSNEEEPNNKEPNNEEPNNEEDQVDSSNEDSTNNTESTDEPQNSTEPEVEIIELDN